MGLSIYGIPEEVIRQNVLSKLPQPIKDQLKKRVEVQEELIESGVEPEHIIWQEMKE